MQNLINTIKRLFNQTEPCKDKDYWKPVSCLAIEEGKVSVRYIFFKHCEGYQIEHWWINDVFKIKLGIFENTDNSNLLVVKASYVESENAFYFTGLLEEDINGIVELLNGYKDGKLLIHKIPHHNYPIIWMKERLTLAMDVKKDEEGYYTIHWCN